MTGRSGRINSAVVIAKLLDCEGFSPETANAVWRYAQRRIGFTERQRHKWNARLKEFREIAAKLSEAEKLVLGKFLAMRHKAAFDAGLRIGLMAYASRTAKDLPNEDWYLSEITEP